jgi:hypothetical protein
MVEKTPGCAVTVTSDTPRYPSLQRACLPSYRATHPGTERLRLPDSACHSRGGVQRVYRDIASYPSVERDGGRILIDGVFVSTAPVRLPASFPVTAHYRANYIHRADDGPASLAGAYVDRFVPAGITGRDDLLSGRRLGRRGGARLPGCGRHPGLDLHVLQPVLHLWNPASRTCCSAIWRTGMRLPSAFAMATPKIASHRVTPSQW